MIPPSPLCPHFNSNLQDFKRSIQKEDWDCIIVNDGMERIGKSTLALYEACQIDEHFEAKQVVDSQRQFEKITDNLDKGQAIVMDEGVHWLFNRNWNTNESKVAVGDLMVIGQLNLAIIINIYNIRYLDIYIREGRLAFATRVKTFKKTITENGKKFVTRGRGLFNFYTRRTIVEHFDTEKNYKYAASFTERFPAIKDLDGGEKLWNDYKKIKRENFDARPRLTDMDKEKEEKELLKLGKNKMKKIKEDISWSNGGFEYTGG